METNFFSIITCTYNSAFFLKKNIDSVKKQNLKDFEHIFIDGFSTDGTIDIIKKYKKEFPNQVKILQFQAEGISKAMNQGIKESDGKYLIHLHSDDSFYNNRVLEDVLFFLKEKNYPDWIYGQINVFDEKGSVGIFPTKKMWQKYNISSIKSYLLKIHNYIPHQAVFIKRGVFDKFGFFDESLKSNMDFDLWLRIRSATRWLFFKRVISNFHIRPGAQSSGYINKKENNKTNLVVKKRYLNKYEIFITNIIDIIFSSRNKNYQK